MRLPGPEHRSTAAVTGPRRSGLDRRRERHAPRARRPRKAPAPRSARSPAAAPAANPVPDSTDRRLRPSAGTPRRRRARPGLRRSASTSAAPAACAPARRPRPAPRPRSAAARLRRRRAAGAPARRTRAATTAGTPRPTRPDAAAAPAASCAPACSSSEVNSTSTRSRSDANPNTVTAPTRPPPGWCSTARQRRAARRPAEQPGLARAVRVGHLHARGADLVEARLGRREQGHVDAVPGHQLDGLVRAGLGLLGRARPSARASSLRTRAERAGRPVHLVPSGRTRVRSRTDLPDGPTISATGDPAARPRRPPKAPRRRRNRCPGSYPRPTLEGPWLIPPPTVPRPAPSRRRPGVYRFSDAAGRVIYVGKAKSLRSRLNSYFADLADLHPRTRQMVTSAAARPVDGRRHRGRGAPARVQLDQGVRPAVQRPLPRRQDLPGARGDGERGVPAAARLPRPAAQGRALLRAVRPRLGHPRDARPPAARLPGPHLQRRGVPAPRPDRAPLPARLHRQVLRPVRRAGQRRRAPRHRRRLLRLPRGPHRPPRSGSWSGGWRPPRRSWSSRRPPACATTSARCAARWSSRPSCSATAPTPTSSRSPTTSSRPRCRSSTCAAAGSAASAAG